MAVTTLGHRRAGVDEQYHPHGPAACGDPKLLPVSHTVEFLADPPVVCGVKVWAHQRQRAFQTGYYGDEEGRNDSTVLSKLPMFTGLAI